MLWIPAGVYTDIIGAGITFLEEAIILKLLKQSKLS
jgi:hypothetical protein